MNSTHNYVCTRKMNVNVKPIVPLVNGLTREERVQRQIKILESAIQCWDVLAKQYPTKKFDADKSRHQDQLQKLQNGEYEFEVVKDDDRVLK